jgi:hypothetical protein
VVRVGPAEAPFVSQGHLPLGSTAVDGPGTASTYAFGAFWLLSVFVGMPGPEADFGRQRSPTPAATRDSVPARVGLALQRYTGRRGADEISTAPDLLRPEVLALMGELGIETAGVESVELTPAERGSYGVWQRVSLADAHLGRAVAPMVREGNFVLGLLGNCISSWGMLAGLQHSRDHAERLARRDAGFGGCRPEPREVAYDRRVGPTHFLRDR